MPRRSNGRRPGPPARRLLVLLALALAVGIGCAQDGRSESRTPIGGTAVDANTGEPIADALIFQVVPAGRSGADVGRIASSRSTRSGAQGQFEFDSASPGFTLGSSYPPRYHFYHPSYGLLRGGEARGGRVRFEASLRDAHLRQADATGLCVKAQQSDANEMVREIAALACPPASPERFSNGQARATGDVDDRGRRIGAWRFFRSDGSVIARGTYRAGAAIDPWSFSSR